MGQNGTTQKKSLGKLSSIFGNFPGMAAAWSTSALRQILFLFLVYIFGEFLTKLFGFSLHHHKNFSLSKLSPFDPIHGVLYTKSWATMQLVSSSTRVKRTPAHGELSSDVDWKRVRGQLARQVMQPKVWYLATLTPKSYVICTKLCQGSPQNSSRVFISANSMSFSSCNLVTSIDSSCLACFGCALNP